MLALVGEAWGEAEELVKLPFFGPAGQELTRMLTDAGIDRRQCFITNVLNMRPPNNDLKSLCVPKRESADIYAQWRDQLVAAHPDFDWPSTYTWPSIAGPGAFLHPRYLSELARLREELSRPGIDLAFALGNTACWALLGRSGIGKLRGYVYKSTLVSGLDILPTYHPASILRQYSNRPVTVADLSKGKRLGTKLLPANGDSGDQTSSTKGRELWIAPTLVDLDRWWSKFVSGPSIPVAVDVETIGTITCVGFGVSAGAISVPFWDRRNKSTFHYWREPVDELAAMTWVRDKLLSPNPKIFQNCLYDLQHFWRDWGVVPNNVLDDTMLIHHNLQLEMPKSLEFLGSIYLDSPAWKDLRYKAHLKAKAEKRDE